MEDDLAPVVEPLRPRARPGEQKAKRELIQRAKNAPCVDCVAEGRNPYWPVESMTIDHKGIKTMWFSTGSDKSTRTGGALPYTEFSIESVRRELAESEPVCANHHNVRSRRQGWRQKSGSGLGLHT